MIVQLLLDQTHGHFTNLDVISGRVILRVPSNNTNISSIVVKLEGESRTRLLAPPRPGYNERPRPVLEVHKLLYRIQTVYPPDGVVDPRAKQSFVINAGQYEYPFQFKIPFNNACTTQNSLTTNLNFVGLAIEVAKTPTQHVKATLPPSLYFPGEAEIRYYVKVTVNRPSLLKENPRQFQNFNFVPIEPPRPKTDGEVYARRQHQFIEDPFPGLSPSDRKGSGFNLFSRKSSSGAVTPVSPLPSREPVRFSVDARLPNPAILTCGQDVSLRVLIKQLSERDEPLYLQTLQIELIGYTKVRAHEAFRTESTSWVLTSLSNLNHEIGSRADDINTETELTKEFWYGHPLPNTVAPSFVTCNLTRTYELLVSVGLSYGSNKQPMGQHFIVLPLRIQVEVYSGIKPPEALLQRMASAPSRPSTINTASAPSVSQQQQQQPTSAPASTPLHQSTDPAAPGYEEPPPSYEDAIAQDLPPVDGPRPDYRPPPPPPEGESTLREKR